MQWSTWWQILFALNACSYLSVAQKTLCDGHKWCSCDALTNIICKCASAGEIVLKDRGDYRIPLHAKGIKLYDCLRVDFVAHSVQFMILLQNIEIYNARYVMIGESLITSHPFPSKDSGFKLIIDNSTIREISSHAIVGFIREIHISNSRIKDIKPFAFSSLKNSRNIELTNNIYDNIEIQAFKQFTTEKFIIEGGNIKTLPSRFLSDVEITNLLRIDKVQIDHIHSLAFLIRSPKSILVADNNIETLEGDAFHAAVRGLVTFRNNTIKNLHKGAFLGFKGEMNAKPELWIDNNTVTNLTPDSLLYNHSVSMHINSLHLNASCSCQLSEAWQDLAKREGGIITCWYDPENHLSTISTYQEIRCGHFKSNFWIYVVVGLILVAAVAGGVIFFIHKREKDRNGRVRLVMPANLTYRETEFHVVLERAELLTTDV